MIVEFLVLQIFHTKPIKIKWNHHRMKVEIVQSSEFCKKKINNALLYNLHCFEDSLTYCCKASGDPIRTEDVDRALLVGFSRSLSAQPASSARLWCTWWCHPTGNFFHSRWIMTPWCQRWQWVARTLVCFMLKSTYLNAIRWCLLM